MKKVQVLSLAICFLALICNSFIHTSQDRAGNNVAEQKKETYAGKSYQQIVAECCKKRKAQEKKDYDERMRNGNKGNSFAPLDYKHQRDLEDFYRRQEQTRQELVIEHAKKKLESKSTLTKQ